MLQTTFLALLGLTAGLVLHFRWHPSRRAFSDAWDFLRLRQALVLLMAGLMLFESAESGFSMVRLEDWRGLWLPLMQISFSELAVLFHALVPPWPLALGLPLALLVLTIRVWRWPYRYGDRVPVPEQKLVLVALTASGVLWTLIEIAGARQMLPEVLEMIKLAGRSVFVALTAAGMQVWLARLVVAWERPTDTEADRDAVAALEATFARWQGVVLLGAFNLLWMSWRSWRVDDTGPVAWLLPELLLLCAALPLSVALAAGRPAFGAAGATALKALLRSLPALVGFAMTALVVLMLARYAVDMAMATFPRNTGLGGVITWCITRLVLAMLHGWLSLTALFLMLRHGFHRPSPAVPAR